MVLDKSWKINYVNKKMYICESVRLLLLCLLVFYVDGMNSDLVHLLMQNRIRSELSVLIWHEFHFDTVSTLEELTLMV